MQFLRTFINWLEDLLVPESEKVAKLLNLPVNQMRELLPKSRVDVKDIFVLFDYDNRMVKLLVKSIKYKNNQSLRRRVAIYLCEEIVDLSSEISLFGGSTPILVPMPMSKEEKRKKGFNQCEELVREIERLEQGNIEVSFEILKKIRETKRQTTLSRDERMVNVRNSMEANNQMVNGKNVIVLDDVYTTLSSFSEAKRALLSAGAKRVYGIFIAH